MVVATQNPIEMEGVFELPEAQRDRFQLKYVIDLPDRDDERELLDRFDSDPAFASEVVEPVVDPETLTAAQKQLPTCMWLTRSKSTSSICGGGNTRVTRRTTRCVSTCSTRVHLDGKGSSRNSRP